MRLNQRVTLYAALLGMAYLPSAHALDTDPGDAVAPPPGMTVVGLYGISQKFDSLYAQGNAIDGPAAQANVFAVRVLHSTQIAGWHVNPQMVLPVGEVSGRNSWSSLPSKSGVGDLFLATSIMLKEDASSRTSVYVMPGITLKTGAYDPQKLSIGSNRNSYLLQLGAQRGVSEKITLDGFVDVTFYDENKSNAAGALSQRPMFSLQTYLRYGFTPTTELALGVRHYHGGETSVAGVSQNDDQRRTMLLLNGSSWITHQTQLMLSYGQDVSINNGLKTKDLLQLRVLTVF